MGEISRLHSLKHFLKQSILCKLRPILVVTKPDISSATDWLHHRVWATL